MQKIKNETINSYLKAVTADQYTDYKLWKSIKRLKRPINQISPIQTEDNKWAKNNEEKAKVFAEYLEGIFSPNDTEGQLDDERGEEMERREPQGFEGTKEIRLVTPREMAREIKINIKPKKVPVFDLITGEVLKQLPRKEIVKMTQLINASFRLRYVSQIVENCTGHYDSQTGRAIKRN